MQAPHASPDCAPQRSPRPNGRCLSVPKKFCMSCHAAHDSKGLAELLSRIKHTHAHTTHTTAHERTCTQLHRRCAPSTSTTCHYQPRFHHLLCAQSKARLMCTHEHTYRCISMSVHAYGCAGSPAHWQKSLCPISTYYIQIPSSGCHLSL